MSGGIFSDDSEHLKASNSKNAQQPFSQEIKKQPKVRSSSFDLADKVDETLKEKKVSNKFEITSETD